MQMADQISNLSIVSMKKLNVCLLHAIFKKPLSDVQASTLQM